MPPQSGSQLPAPVQPRGANKRPHALSRGAEQVRACGNQRSALLFSLTTQLCLLQQQRNSIQSHAPPPKNCLCFFGLETPVCGGSDGGGGTGVLTAASWLPAVSLGHRKNTQAFLTKPTNGESSLYRPAFLSCEPGVRRRERREGSRPVRN